MAKRFTDTEKWKKVWFRKLSPINKCFWMYLVDNCNHAGIWEVDFELAEFQIGTSLDKKEIEKVFSEQITKLNSDSKWLINDFVKFQYNNDLNPNNKAHKSVINILNNLGIDKPLSSPLVGVKDIYKDKDKDKVIEKGLEKQIEPLKSKYAPSLIEDFILYWSETNKKGKQRWELEKTWDINLRLKKWKRQQEKWDREKSNRLKKDPKPKSRESTDTGFTSISKLLIK